MGHNLKPAQGAYIYSVCVSVVVCVCVCVSECVCVNVSECVCVNVVCGFVMCVCYVYTNKLHQEISGFLFFSSFFPSVHCRGNFTIVSEFQY